MADPARRTFSYRDDPAVPSFDDAGPLFVFDGICVLCSGGARWLMRRDRGARLRFASAQSPLGQALYAHYGIAIDDSYLLLDQGRAYTASRGYLRLCAILGGWWHVLRLAAIVPRPVRDALYAIVARNRYRWFGKTEYCALLDEKQHRRLL